MYRLSQGGAGAQHELVLRHTASLLRHTASLLRHTFSAASPTHLTSVHAAFWLWLAGSAALSKCTHPAKAEERLRCSLPLPRLLRATDLLLTAPPFEHCLTHTRADPNPNPNHGPDPKPRPVSLSLSLSRRG